MEKINFTQLTKNWDKILNHPAMPVIKDSWRKKVTAAVLENQQVETRKQATIMSEAAAANSVTGGGISNWDPVLISLVRRALPNIVAYDIASVQPMNGPVGLIFAMKSRYSTQDGTEALFNEPNTAFSGAGSHAGAADSLGSYGTDTTPADTVEDSFATGIGMSTAAAEALGTSGGGSFGEMAFSIEKATVTAKSRALKAMYTVELAQDLNAIHGLDAETELANILSVEILNEINREIIRTINLKAKLGCQQSNVTAAGKFDVSTDSDGRWAAEKFKGLAIQIDREANVIAQDTRRGKGNFVICSSDVATALAASGMLDYAPKLSTDLEVDDTGNVFAGMLNGRIKVFIDPFSTNNYINVGYKGTSPYDAGMFYCPYVPLIMGRAVGEDDFQPRIAFKTRYGMIANPFVGTTPDNDTGANRANPYYRISAVVNILT